MQVAVGLPPQPVLQRDLCAVENDEPRAGVGQASRHPADVVLEALLRLRPLVVEALCEPLQKRAIDANVAPALFEMWPVGFVGGVDVELFVWDGEVRAPQAVD